MSALVGTAPFSRLTSLNLARNEIAADGARAIATAASCSQLTWLNLRGNALGPEGARAIAAAAHFHRLEHLNLGYNALGVARARSPPHTSRRSGRSSCERTSSAPRVHVPSPPRRGYHGSSGSTWARPMRSVLA